MTDNNKKPDDEFEKVFGQEKVKHPLFWFGLLFLPIVVAIVLSFFVQKPKPQIDSQVPSINEEVSQDSQIENNKPRKSHVRSTRGG